MARFVLVVDVTESEKLAKAINGSDDDWAGGSERDHIDMEVDEMLTSKDMEDAMVLVLRRWAYNLFDEDPSVQVSIQDLIRMDDVVTRDRFRWTGGTLHKMRRPRKSA